MTDERERALEDARKWLAGGFPGMTCGLVDQLATGIIDTSAQVERLTEENATFVQLAKDESDLVMRLHDEKATQAARIETLEGALRSSRVFVQGTIDTCHDHSVIGNLMAARDTIDAALSHTKSSKEG
jgi:hypothetical protein